MVNQPVYPPPQYGYTPPVQRSAIPKVIGILMIIFGSIGLLGGVIGLAGSGMNNAMFRDVPELSTYRTVEMLLSVVGLTMAGFQLYAGVRAVGYKANAPGIAKAYAIAAIVIVIASLVINMAVLAPMMARAMDAAGMHGMGGFIGGFTLIISLFGLAWPIIVLTLMTRPTAKAACTAQL